MTLPEVVREAAAGKPFTRPHLTKAGFYCFVGGPYETLKRCPIGWGRENNAVDLAVTADDITADDWELCP